MLLADFHAFFSFFLFSAILIFLESSFSDKHSIHHLEHYCLHSYVFFVILH